MQLCCEVKATVSRCVTVPDYIWLLNLCPTVITSSWLHSSCLSFLPQPPGFNFDSEALNLPGVPGAGAEQCSIMWWGGHTACQWHWSHKSPLRAHQRPAGSGKEWEARPGRWTLISVSAKVCVDAEAREGVLDELKRRHTQEHTGFGLNH